FPLERVNGHNFHFVWDNSLTASDANWSVTLGLQNNGHRIGGFSLYRNNAQSPLWMDMNVFITTGFSSELARVIERIEHSRSLAACPKPSILSHCPSAASAASAGD